MLAAAVLLCLMVTLVFLDGPDQRGPGGEE